MGLPPLPQGASLIKLEGNPAAGMMGSRSRPPDPLKLLKDEGFTWTNGFRTPADTDRIRAQGYNPAENSLHLDGDALDLEHPTLSPSQQAARLNSLFSGWEGARVRDEGHHRHLQLPGWHAAPGTPGTPNAGIPPLPDGAELVQRGSLDATPPMDETAARIATINQGDWSAQERARLIDGIRNEGKLAPLTSTATYGRAFFDEIPEGVASKLSPQQLAGWQALARDPNSTPDQLRAYMKAQGFDIAPGNAEEIVKARNAGAGVNEDVVYRRMDAISLGDGAGGAFGRGVGDPFNILDETGAAFDTLGLTRGRENVFNSDRSIGDILHANIDANRAILDADNRDYWKARLGGQLLSSVVLPIGNKANTAGKLAKWGAVEGGLAGFGAGEGDPIQRAPGTVAGAAFGAGGGYVLGKGIEAGAPLVRRVLGREQAPGAGIVARDSAFESAPVVNDAIQNAGPTPAAKTQPRGGLMGERVEAMAADFDAPTLTGPLPRQRDYLDMGNLPPLPEGASLLDDVPLGRVRRMGEQPTAEEMATIAREVLPEDVIPLPNNRVETLAEFDAIGGANFAGRGGASFFDDATQPVGLDDLRSVDREMPAVAYEDLPTSGGRAGNINLDHLETRADIRRALMSSESRVSGFDAARRGRISHAETAALADELNMTPDDLLRRRNGQALNAEQALAARRILAKSGEELVALAKRVQGGSDEDVAAFRKAWLRHVAIQEQVTGATAEAGRALAQFRMAARSKDARVRVLQGLAEGGGGRDRIEDVANRILDLQKDPGTLNRFTSDAMKPRFSDKLVELWYNSLLSGPATHVVNTVSNTLTSLSQIPEHAVGAAVGLARTGLNRGEADRVLFSEVGARGVGLLQGTKEGLRQFGRTMRTGGPSDFMSKVESRRHEAISGLKGSIIRTPTRMLAAEDELFKAMARRMELAGLAVRKAHAEGLKGDAAKARAAHLAANPTDEMLESSFDYGRYVTFQRPLGRIAQPISNITNAAPMLKLVVPFIRTPTNIFKFAVERSPAAPILKEVRDEFRAGGARRDMAIAKVLVGTGVGALATQLAAEGHITGSGPADENAKALLRADGWQPYSVRLGDRYYSYQRLDPFATTLGIAADLAAKSEYMTEEQKDHVSAMLTAAIVQQIQSKTWLSGFTDLTQAIDDPDRYADAYISKLAGSIAVPSIVNQAARTIDPVLREAKTPLDRIKSRIPGLSQSLPARRDAFGEQIRSEGGIGPDFISPIWESTRRNDPVVNELLTVGAHVSQPSRRVAGRLLEDHEYAAYSELAGRYIKEDLADAMTGPEWTELQPWEKSDEAERIIRAARRDAREELGLVSDGDGNPPPVLPRQSPPIAGMAAQTTGASTALPPLPAGAELLPLE